MKTVKPVHGGLPERVKDQRAEELVASGKYTYCLKTEWKQKVRDLGKRPVTPNAVNTTKPAARPRAKDTK